MTKIEWLDRFLRVRKCAACGEIIAWSPDPGAFCEECRKQWEYAKIENCSTCFQSAIDCTCMPKLLSDSGALCLRKLFFYHPERYKEVSNRLVYFIKRHQTYRVFCHLAKDWMPQLAEELQTLGIENKAEECLLVSLPRGWTARSHYGFDQSDRLCRALSDVTGIPYLSLIRRKMGGVEQKKLKQRERLRNMKRRLILRKKRLEKSGVELSKRTVILVDDLVTTGTTMAAAISILRRAGVRRVICLSIAKTE